MDKGLGIFLLFLGSFVLLALMGVKQVPPGCLGIYIVLGRPVKKILTPKWYLCLPRPFMDIKFTDSRLLRINPGPLNVLAKARGKNIPGVQSVKTETGEALFVPMRIDASLAARVKDPYRVLTGVKNPLAVLWDMVASITSETAGDHFFDELPTPAVRKAMEGRMRQELKDAADHLGLELGWDQTRVQSVDYMPDHAASLLQIQIAENQGEAEVTRARGEATAFQIEKGAQGDAYLPKQFMDTMAKLQQPVLILGGGNSGDSGTGLLVQILKAIQNIGGQKGGSS